MNDLAPGFRFYPTEEELLSFYLHNKLESRREDMERVIPVAEVYFYDPWQLPQISGEPCLRDSEQWFFFRPWQAREAHGGRPTRTTPSGYWKATGSPSVVYSSGNRALGVKKTMVFYQGRTPTGTKTKWKMNEYRAFEEDSTTSTGATPKLRSEFSLCRLYTRSGCLRSFDRRPSVTAASKRQVATKRARSHASSSSDDDDGTGTGTGLSVRHGGAIDSNVIEESNWDLWDWD